MRFLKILPNKNGDIRWWDRGNFYLDGITPFLKYKFINRFRCFIIYMVTFSLVWIYLTSVLLYSLGLVVAIYFISILFGVLLAFGSYYAFTLCIKDIHMNVLAMPESLHSSFTAKTDVWLFFSIIMVDRNIPKMLIDDHLFTMIKGMLQTNKKVSYKVLREYQEKSIIETWS